MTTATPAPAVTDERLAGPDADNDLVATICSMIAEEGYVGRQLTARRIIALVDADRGRAVKSP